MRSSLHLTDDTNQFGPGTDLMISLVAVLLVLTMAMSHLYQRQKTASAREAEIYRLEHRRCVVDSLALAGITRDSAVGTFHVAPESFPAADFYVRPVTRPVNPEETARRVSRIVDDYHRQNFPYIFVIGHSSATDDPRAPDRSRAARLQRNWEYAGRRAAFIAAQIEERLGESERDRLVVMTTGELDLRIPADPQSQENAWVEVVFGKEWKPPSASALP